MPHLVILYTPQLDAECDMTALCRRLADTMLAQRDDEGRPVFPVGGTRVLAYPAAHHAVADGSGDHAFAWFHLRMARGRPEALRQRIGEALVAAARAQLAPLLAARPLGLTLQVEEGAESFDGRFGNLHASFGAPRA
ncbi:MAG: 5-carboxymethyl-2-hydroxymuconate isomerase [Rubrivivax sp.]|nr:5-carboxymethyl-2-hydroxymuconate isomerase [Rubrivivax sp.]